MSSKLQIVALTGGIATGKSTCCRLIQEMLPDTVLFDADACVRQLYHHPEVHQELKGHFGVKVMLSSGEVDKTYLRACAFSNDEDRLFLEQIFHHRVIEECLALLAQTASNPSSRLFVADIPLLFEGGFDLGQSANLLVATSRKTQVSRLKNRNAWDDDTVKAVLDAQMPIDAKLTLADVVFWNEGPVKMLKAQIQRYLTHVGQSF